MRPWVAFILLAARCRVKGTMLCVFSDVGGVSWRLLALCVVLVVSCVLWFLILVLLFCVLSLFSCCVVSLLLVGWMAYV